MLYFECPSCKSNCETTPAFAGKAVFCPHCGKSVTVPTDPAAVTTTPPLQKPKPAPALTTPQVAAAEQQAAAPSLPQDPTMNQVRNVILVLIGIAVLVFLAVWLIPGEAPKKDSKHPAPEGPNPVVVMETSMGTVKIELFQDKAPITVANFLRYVDDKHYGGTIFHRVMSDFMIQGGGFEPGMRPKGSKYPRIKNEASNGLANARGTVAMARTNDPDSATDQFFINVADNSRKLGPGDVDPYGYAVFGKVIEGMDVVDKIRRVPVRDIPPGHQAVPFKDVMIKSIRRAE